MERPEHEMQTLMIVIAERWWWWWWWCSFSWRLAKALRFSGESLTGARRKKIQIDFHNLSHTVTVALLENALKNPVSSYLEDLWRFLLHAEGGCHFSSVPFPSTKGVGRMAGRNKRKGIWNIASNQHQKRSTSEKNELTEGGFFFSFRPAWRFGKLCEYAYTRSIMMNNSIHQAWAKCEYDVLSGH